MFIDGCADSVYKVNVRLPDEPKHTEIKERKRKTNQKASRI